MLLQQVSGQFCRGEMAALMGPSGSGKTTLLDVLSGRKTVGRIKGSILYGGAKPTRNFLRVRTAYVEQFDSLLANMTVEENLQYTCEMRAPSEMPLAAKRARVRDVIDALDLSRCCDVRVGSSLARGISGGQAKRTNIGLALVAEPAVLYLDEPTTGLDSYTAHEVMTAVWHLCRRGLTVCATIHSPTPATVALFSSLVILVRGRTVYAGPNGEVMLDHFRAAAGFLGPSPISGARMSDIEWVTDVTVRADREGAGERLAEAYASSEVRTSEDARRAQLLAAVAELPEGRAVKAFRGHTQVSAWRGLLTLAKHRGRRDYTDLGYLVPRILDKFLMGFILFTLFWHQGKDLSSPNIPNVVVVLFMWTLLVSYSAGTYVPSLLLERALFVRERNDGLYLPSTYLAFKLLEECALQLVLSLPISAMVFYPIELKGSWVLFWLVYYVTSVTGISLAYLMAALAPDLDAANSFLPLVVTILLFFCGLLIRFDAMPKYWQWFAYIDFLRYSWGALMINQFKDQNTYWFFFETLTYFSLNTYSKWIFLLYTFISALVFMVFTWMALCWVKHVVR